MKVSFKKCNINIVLSYRLKAMMQNVKLFEFIQRIKYHFSRGFSLCKKGYVSSIICGYVCNFINRIILITPLATDMRHKLGLVCVKVNLTLNTHRKHRLQLQKQRLQVKTHVFSLYDLPASAVFKLQAVFSMCVQC